MIRLQHRDEGGYQGTALQLLGHYGGIPEGEAKPLQRGIHRQVQGIEQLSPLGLPGGRDEGGKPVAPIPAIDAGMDQGEQGELLQGALEQAVLGGKRRGADRGQLLPEQGLAVGIAPQAGLVDDGEIERLPGEVDAVVVAAAYLHRLPLERLQPPQHPAAGAGGHLDADGLLVGQGLQGAEPLPHAHQPLPDEGQQALGGRGQGQAAGAAHEQQVPQARLQLGDLLAHGPLADAQLVGGQGEAQVTGGALEDLQTVEGQLGARRGE